ncbi:PhzF family phenazine biosynthesis protein [Vibrio tritonius]|uniref:PhzF family phenazine biosynthesis protein n=1 Tax=Vibrio tritonius TaxID=1435069 RepID=UPI0008387F7B|nr:PhzF family phenazine biosynthesis protein [Vibrio tritonius]
MELDIYQVDAFTTEAFKGNPAGVCISDEELREGQMLSIAREMALSETAFYVRNTHKLRWFTPEVEVALCGHGTLALAHILQESGEASFGDTLCFETMSGPLSATIEENYIALNFPVAELQGAEVAREKLDLLGIDEDSVVSYLQFDSKELIEIDSEQLLISLTPSFERLKQLPGRGIVVTSKAGCNKLDFISRYFAPWVGVNEDPVTGSAHCALAAYWGEKLKKHQLNGYQASQRGGNVGCTLLPNHRVELRGKAKTIVKGKLYL